MNEVLSAEVRLEFSRRDIWGLSVYIGYFYSVAHSVKETKFRVRNSPMNNQKPAITVLGTGFAAFNLVKDLSADYAITVVSPRNHFLFTPLLPSTTVGTIEFRSIIEPIRYARDDIRFFHASAESTQSCYANHLV